MLFRHIQQLYKQSHYNCCAGKDLNREKNDIKLYIYVGLKTAEHKEDLNNDEKQDYGFIPK